MELTDDDIIARLGKLHERWILEYFWTFVRQTRESKERLTVLGLLGRVKVERPADWNPRAIRDAHDHAARVYQGVNAEKLCFVCNTGRRLFIHHVVEVQHGGSNDQRNRVALCFPCHQRLHPWLDSEPAPLHQFEPLKTIMPRALNLLKLP